MVYRLLMRSAAVLLIIPLAGLALLSKYSTHARSPDFTASAERFRDYAVSLRDRWQSVPQIFMAGGNLPPSSRRR